MKRISLTFYPACFVSPKITLFLILLFLSVSSHAEIKSPASGAEKVVEVIGNLFSTKIIEINESDLQVANSGVSVSGTATFFRSEKASVEVRMSGTNIQTFIANFGGNVSLKPKHFSELTDQKIDKWLPGSLEKGVFIKSVTFTFKPEGNKLTTMNLELGIADTWQPVAAMPLEISSITGEYEIRNYSGPGKKQNIFRLHGKSKIGSSIIDLTGETNRASADWTFTAALASIPLSDLLNNLIEKSQFPLNELPSGVLALDIKQANVILKPQQKSLSLTGNSTYGEIEANISPVNQKKNAPMGYMIGYGLPAGFPFGNIHSVLTPLEKIELENTALVISSEARSESGLAAIQRMGVDARLNRGVNILAKYDLRPSGLDRLLKIEKINIRGAFSNNPNDLLLSGDVDTNIPLGSHATFRKIVLNLKPAPGKMEASLGGEIDLQVKQDKLLFRANAGVNAMTQALFVEAALDGAWNNPLDIKGMRLEDLWMRMDLSFRTVPIPMPGVGLSGIMKIKDFEGDLTMYVNPAIPSESMLDAGLNELNMQAILESFVSEQVKRNIPKEMTNIVGNFSLKNARLTVVPNPAGITINNKTYDPGFKVKGDAKIQELHVSLAMSVDYNDGVAAYGELQPIVYGSMFKLTGSRGNPNPLLDLTLNATAPPKVRATGLVHLMGLQAETDIYLNDQGFDFFIAGKIHNSFEASLNVKGSNLKQAPGFYIKAEMKQDLMDYITREASKEIDQATKDTQADFRNAQADIVKWNKELDRLNPLIEERKAKVQKARDKDMAKVKAAEDAVEKARLSVQSLQSSIDGKHNDIKVIDDIVNAKKRWIDSAPNFVEKGVRSTKSAPFFTEQAALRAAKMTEIAGLETSKASANITLTGARESLKAIQHLSNFTPIELDPSIAPLIASQKSAQGSLKAAGLVLKGAEFASVGTLKATKYIVENGPHQVVKINYAMFEGKLDVVNDGFVRMRLKGTFANDPLDTTIEINLKNPLKDIIKFADGLL
ncbi:MAG: hypothetical protein KDD99_22560 [Bacteroidetes bacterium]|nr:hypothetical protein [Bacteroidota bacterium]